MGILAVLRRTFGLSLALMGLGCTSFGSRQSLPPKTIWAEDYEGLTSRNSSEAGKFTGTITDDRSGKPAPSSKQEGTAETAQGQKQIPLDRGRMIIMPDGSEESENPPDASARDECDKDSPKITLPPQALPAEIDKMPPRSVEVPERLQGSGKQYPPYIRRSPTAKGEILELGPYDKPVEKAVEFAQKLAASEADNRFLSFRLRKIEADLEAREKALTEATGEVEQATSDIVKTRGDLQGLRKEVAGLREKLKQAEKDEIETMKSVIAALERLLQTQPAKSKE
jgi:hypothetical protein